MELPAFAADVTAPAALAIDGAAVVAPGATEAAKAGFLAQLDAAFADETPTGGDDDPGEAPFALIVAPPAVLPEPVKLFAVAELAYGFSRLPAASGPPPVDPEAVRDIAAGATPHLETYVGDEAAGVLRRQAAAAAPTAPVTAAEIDVTAAKFAEIARAISEPSGVLKPKTSTDVVDSRGTFATPSKPTPTDDTSSASPRQPDVALAAAGLEGEADHAATDVPLDALKVVAADVAASQSESKDVQPFRSTTAAHVGEAAGLEVTTGQRPANGEQGAESAQQGAGSGEKGAGNEEHATGSGERAGNGERGAGNGQSHQLTLATDDFAGQSTPRVNAAASPPGFAVESSSAASLTPAARMQAASSVPLPSTGADGEAVMQQVVQAIRWQWNGASG
ncbi:MAG TPA: hypothetical protein VEA16_14670, partial [Vicinamibacterales bacterium]|nr:hypothetical protein [Vicinamibacterales bacterium]